MIDDSWLILIFFKALKILTSDTGVATLNLLHHTSCISSIGYKIKIHNNKNTVILYKEIVVIKNHQKIPYLIPQTES
jgi:hypothetical protein